MTLLPRIHLLEYEELNEAKLNFHISEDQLVDLFEAYVGFGC